MEKINRGNIIEIEVPYEKKPIKALVLDVIENSKGNHNSCYVYILYAQNKIFRAFNWCHWGVARNIQTGEQEEYTEWSNFTFDGIIVYHCNISNLPSDI